MKVLTNTGNLIGEFNIARYANLQSADLRSADLRSAILQSADLRYADLQSANLRYANLRSANLQSADLRYADLRSANLRSANLRSANLRYADLQYADLQSANLRYAILPDYWIIPTEGAFTAFKKVIGKNGQDTVIKIQIPAKAKRTCSIVGRKCRAEYVKVIRGSGISKHDEKTSYAPGKIVKADSFDPDPRIECSNGIHFFITEKEAREY